MAASQVATLAGLDSGTEMELTSYRYKVFVKHLGWELPQCDDGTERDQFDTANTVYAWVRDAAGHVCGCARLLPTTGPYLLEQVFPHLLDGAPAPHSPRVWELSRYTTELVRGEDDCAAAAQERFRALLRAVVSAAQERGAQRLITFSYVGVERIARRFGLHVHRAGTIHRIDERPCLAFWIELDQHTMAALDIPSSRTTAVTAPAMLQ